MGNPIKAVQWNTKGEWKELTESQWVDGRRMFKPLLIPGAPWMQWYVKITIAFGENNQFETIGQEEFRQVTIAGEKDSSRLMMWKSTYTNGKWIGVNRDKIYESDDSGKCKQLGWIAFKELTIEANETVMLMMTKGMASNAQWEGDVGDTAYIEKEEGKGTPIGKLEFRPVKLSDGSETVILSFRSLNPNSKWVSVRNGVIIRSK